MSFTRANFRVLCASALLLGGCSQDDRPVTREWAVMGTFAAVTVRQEDAAKLDLYGREAARIFKQVNDTLTVYTQVSELSAVNRSAGLGPVETGELSGEAIDAALRYAELSGGHFDPTVAPLVKMWGFNDGTAPESLPPSSKIGEALEGTGYKHVRLSGPEEAEGRQSWRVQLELPGMSLDLGGIAKGFAVDRCFERLQQLGADNVMVNLGGNIRCGGRARPDRPWRIGVRNPFDEAQLLGVLEIPDGWAVATSGNYERYVLIGGKRYAHIINPRTGYPVEGMAGVTAVSRTAVQADAMSTAFFVMGPEKAKNFIPRLPGCEALFVKDEQPIVVWITPGFGRWFAPSREFAESIRFLDD